jgi:hypothetical protein
LEVVTTYTVSDILSALYSKKVLDTELVTFS